MKSLGKARGKIIPPVLSSCLTVMEQFNLQVTSYPNQLAIHTHNYQWTYSELSKQINNIAQGILQAHNSVQAPIVLLLEQDAPMIAAMLAVLKLGCIYVPLDPSFPQEKIATILKNVKPDLIISDNHNKNFIQNFYMDCPLISIEQLDRYNCLIDNKASLESPAYIIYTTGSTGAPKGVLQNQKNLLHHNRVYSKSLKITPHDRISLLTSFAYDAALMDIYAALLNGASLYVFPVKHYHPRQCLEWLYEHKITIYHSTPTLYRMLMQQSVSYSPWKRLRWVVLGGEVALGYDFELFKQHCSDSCGFVNGLGPTESTLALQLQLNSAQELVMPTIPVGFPVEATSVFLLGADGELSNEGEIVIQSDYLALGYWNDTQNQTKFIRYENQRAYRSGDMARRLHDGSLEFLGRKDGEVKIRGQKVNIPRLENLLRQSLALLQVVVIPYEDPQKHLQLWAYYVAEQECCSKTLFHLSQDRSEEIWPSLFLRITDFPLLLNGKINRKQLALMLTEDQAQVNPKPHEMAFSVNDKLKHIWANILSYDENKIQPDDNFFVCGGNSLSAMQLLTEIHQNFNIEFSLRNVLQKPTFGDIAESIDKQLLNNPVPKTTEVMIYNNQALPIQEDFWTFQHFNPTSSALNLIHTLHLQGTLNIDALEQALTMILSRHEVLRTTFHLDKFNLKQTIHPDLKPVLKFHNLSEYGPHRQVLFVTH